MKKFILFFLIAAWKNSSSQDGYFNCFQRTLLYNNPAFAGSSGYLRVQTAANYVWPGIGGYFNSFAGVDSYVGKGSSVGLSWGNQLEGDVYKKMSVSVYYCNRISLSKKKVIVQPGISISYLQNSVDYGKMHFGSEIDSVNGFVRPSKETNGLNRKSNLDINIGFLIFNKYFFSGISILHFTQPDEGLTTGPSKLPMRINLHSGGNIAVTRDIFVCPSLQYSKQEDFQYFSLGCSGIIKKWATGVNYSFSKFISVNVGFQNERLKIGVSHSVFFGGIPYTTTYGAYEANISFVFLNPDPERKFISPKGF